MQYDNETKYLIEQLDKQAKEIQAKIDDLKNGNCKCARWRAKEGEYYYSFDGFLDISLKTEALDKFDDCRYNSGFYFGTREDAEKYKNHLIITQKIKDIALRLNNGVDIDLNDYCDLIRPKYKIVLKPYENKLIQSISTSTVDLCQIYCLSDKFLETCIKEIGEKELIEYMKGC